MAVVLGCLMLGAAACACVQISEEQPATTKPAPPPDASPGPCSERASRLVYAIGSQGTLYSFDPAHASFEKILDIDCLDEGDSPTSMAVDRNGIAYLDSPSGALLRLDTQTGACTRTTFDPSATGFATFYGAFATTRDGGEALFGTWSSATAPRWVSVLGTIDTNTLLWETIGEYSPLASSGPMDQVLALTGTGDGLLFALIEASTAGSVFVVRMDPATATVIDRDRLSGVEPEAGAFVVWGGEFYLFQACGGDLCRVDPKSRTITRLRIHLGDTITVAAVSTCAPP